VTTHPETAAALVGMHKAHADEAIISLRRIKEAVAQGDSREVLAGMISREIRELENLRRTGRRCPVNTLEVA
jgi:hypothetical protein